MASKKFTEKEIKLLKLFNRLFKTVPSYNTFNGKLIDYGFDDVEDELVKSYRLFLNNYREDGQYELTEKVDRGIGKLANLIRKIIKKDYESEREMDDILNSREISGEFFYDNRNNFVEFDTKGIKLHMDSEDWRKYFSGLSEEDTWFYNMANSHYGYSEEVDDDELKYMERGLPEDVREKISILADMVGDLNISTRIKTDGLDEGEFSDFLELNFPKQADRIFTDYLSDYGYALGRSRSKGVTDEYEKGVKFQGKGSADIFIPWKDLLKMVITNPMVTTLSDLKDLEINGDHISLEGAWYESYPDKEEMADTYRQIEKHIDDLIDGIEDGEIKLENTKEIWEIINRLGFKKEGDAFRKTSESGIEIVINKISPEKNELEIIVQYPKGTQPSKWGDETMKRTIKATDLGTWLNSLPLDRQVESFKKILHTILKESNLKK
jgi:hypothetical protein